MSEVTTELVIGAQSLAARRIADSTPVLQEALRSLASGIQQEQAGFTGNVAGSFYGALESRFRVGAEMCAATTAYAGMLVEVDRSVATSQQAQSAAYQRAAASLSAWSFE